MAVDWALVVAICAFRRRLKALGDDQGDENEASSVDNTRDQTPGPSEVTGPAERPDKEIRPGDEVRIP
jgi:hypothetical protein